MDAFSTAAMNDFLERAPTQNAQMGSGDGRTIDENKDPRRRKQENVTKDRNTLPIRSGTSDLGHHRSPHCTLQEELRWSDPHGKPAVSVITAQPTPRSGNIGHEYQKLEQPIWEMFPLGADTFSSGSAELTAATERNDNIGSHSSLPQAMPSDPMKSRPRHPPLWSTSSERYRELFRKANPIDNNKVIHRIPYDIEESVLADSTRTKTPFKGERHNDQEVSPAIPSINKTVFTNAGSRVLVFNPLQPSESRKSLHLFDTVSRLLEDSKGGVEYVKGIGVMRLEAEDASIERQPAHKLHKNHQTNDNMTHVPNEERSFTIEHITTEYMDLVDVEIRWTAQSNAFVWHKDQQVLQDLPAIPAQTIEAVSYNLDGQCFHLCLGARKEPELRCPFKDLLLIMTAPPLEFMMLKSLFETSIGAIKVNMVDETYFLEKARDIQQLRRLPRPTFSTTVKPVVGVERLTLDGLVHKAKDLHEPSKEELDVAVNDPAKAEPGVEINEALETIGEVEAVDEIGVVREVEVANESGIDSEVGIGKEVGIVTEVFTQKTLSTPDATADARIPPKLLYITGEAVTLGDLVIRLRDEEEIKNGMDPSKELDVYDGPWVVSELPFSGAIMSSGIFEDDVVVSSKAEDKLMHGMQQKLLKLDFPPTSKAEPWTKLGRLRPVYGIPAGAASRGARTAYQQLQGSDKDMVVNIHTGDTDFDSEGPTGVARIREEAYVFLQYVSFEAMDPDTFEVQKLRGKKLWRYSMEDCEDPVTDCTDPMILRYLGREGGYVKEDEVLMVKYLVHWAGWPSEDDTWEVGHGNIPQNLMEEYDVNMGGTEEEGLSVTKTIADMTRNFKSRKKTKRKSKATSVRNRKRKSAAEDPFVINSDSEDSKQEPVHNSKRRASAPMVKAIQGPKSD